MKSLRQVWAAAQGNPRNPKIAKRFKRSKNQEAKRTLIPLTLHRTANPVTQPPDAPRRAFVRDVTPVPGCRVSLLVSMGVMGFLGDLGGEIEIFP